MKTPREEFPLEVLHDLVFALAGSGTTIEDYLPTCEQLWTHPDHRPWIVTALLRKVGEIVGEPDEACIEFIAGKTIEFFGHHDLPGGPSKEIISEYLPAIVYSMPDMAWTKPLALWHVFIASVASEFGAPVPEGHELDSGGIDNKAVDLADLFAQAIGPSWTQELDTQLESWREAPEYAWLVALRRGKRLNMLLEATQQQVETSANALETQSWSRLTKALAEVFTLPSDSPEIMDKLAKVFDYLVASLSEHGVLPQENLEVEGLTHLLSEGYAFSTEENTGRRKKAGRKRTSTPGSSRQKSIVAQRLFEILEILVSSRIPAYEKGALADELVVVARQRRDEYEKRLSSKPKRNTEANRRRKGKQ